MKRLIIILVICIVTPFLNNGRIEEVNQKFYMTAVIQEIDEKIQVDVISGEYAYGVYLVITGDETKYYGENKLSIERSSLKVGDTIKIVYGGQVMMSYPPQIVAREIYVI